MSEERVSGFWAKVSSWLRLKFSDSERFLILCIVAGVACGLTGVALHYAIGFIYELFFRPDSGHRPAWWVLLFAPALGGLVVGIVIHRFAPRAAGSGIPQTKEAYHNHFGMIRIKDGLFRFLTCTISVGMGNSVGREGPTAHICSAIAAKIGQTMGLAKMRLKAMVPVGMGAGIAAAFDTPLAAIFFVFEELLGDFSSKALGGLVVAVVVAAAVERTFLGEAAVLQVDTAVFEIDTWMLVSIPLGLVAALLGTLFVKSILALRQRFKEWTLPPWLKPAVGGLGVGLIGTSVFFILQQQHLGVFGVGYQDLNASLQGSLTFWVMVILFVGKFIATLFCYAAGGTGGIFAPVLFLGSMLGGIFGVALVEVVGFDSRIADACALLGMGAFFAAVIRCPMTSILIIFEMTQNYSLILPLMAGNMIAYFLARRLQGLSIYDALLVQDRVSLKKLPTYRGDKDWRNLPVTTITTYELVCVAGDQTMTAAFEAVCEKKHHAYPVIRLNEDGLNRLVGMITYHELRDAWQKQSEVTVADFIADQQLVYVHPDQSIRDVANTLVVQDKMQVPVVSQSDPERLIGIVTLHDVARQQNAIEDQIERGE
ncbi:MAG: chloride channel protein [Opitutales bacterium]|nr:chloride channel protein [Opitutales bacterium]NRA27047.1 chloride channel protein [Opitutales bacterium]